MIDLLSFGGSFLPITGRDKPYIRRAEFRLAYRAVVPNDNNGWPIGEDGLAIHPWTVNYRGYTSYHPTWEAAVKFCQEGRHTYFS